MSGYYSPSSAEYLNPTDHRRVVYVTGGNSGIGWFTVLHLYLHGYIVYVGGRTELKVRKALEEIEQEAVARIETYTEEERKLRFVGELHYSYIDLTDLATVNDAATAFLQKEPALHTLILNAGIMGIPYAETKDGYEIQYQVNYLAHFLLTLRLLPALEAVAAEGQITPRIVELTSVGHNFAMYHIKPGDKLNKVPNFIYTWIRYGNAKASAIQIIREFAERYTKILSVSVHPGVVIGTELYNHWKSLPVIGAVARNFLSGVDRTGGVTVEQGALATLRAALDESITLKDSGKYYVTGGKEGKPSRIASNPAYSKQVWDYSYEELTKNNLLR